MKSRAVPFVAVGIAGLFLASAVGAVVVKDGDDDVVATVATSTTFPFLPFEESTTTSLVDPNATVVTEVPGAPVSLAPVEVPPVASTTSTVAAAATPTLATDPAPCQVPPSQPADGAAAGPSGVFAVTVGNGKVRLTNPIGRLPAYRPKTGQVVSVSVASGKPPGLCLSGTAGEAAKRLATPVNVGRPSVSFDGARLAVRSGRPGGADIVVGAVEGADQKVILQSTDLGDPVWLGNGTAVVVCALTSGARRLVAVPGGGGEPRVLRDTCPSSLVASSPDGSRIAFVQANQLTVLNTTTRALSNLKIGTTISTAAAPSWSPDGKKVAFGYTDATGPALGIVDLDTGKAATPFRGPNLTSPSWAPAGDLIAYTGTEGSGQALSIVKPDGTGRRPVAACQTRCSLAAQPWSTDGATVVLELTGAAA